MPVIKGGIYKVITRDKTSKQKVNLVLAYLHFKIRSIYLFSYPIRLTIDPSNYCNLRCVLCPVGTKALGRKRAFMKSSTFKKSLMSAVHIFGR